MYVKLIGKKKYALTCQSYSSNGGTICPQPILLSHLPGKLMPFFPVVSHISSRCASYHMRDSWENENRTTSRDSASCREWDSEATLTKKKMKRKNYKLRPRKIIVDLPWIVQNCADIGYPFPG